MSTPTRARAATTTAPPTPVHHRWSRIVATLLALVLVAAACGGDDETASNDDEATTDATETATGGADEDAAGAASDGASSGTGAADVAASEVATDGNPFSCDEIAAQFGTDGSANPDLVDPESSAVCDGDSVVISSNGIPDYTYIETSPGPPRAQDHTFTIPASPTVAETTTAVPLLGPLGVTLAGIPIYGPTEGTGGDVESIDGILMECGGHNGPTGFHLHLLGTSDSTDCDFTAEEVASGPQLLGYAFDGYPIYTGNDQYESSWELTDASLFATDTWSAHTYVEGSGDLDECNGRVDGDGNYAYYTTDSFPYVVGCFVGDVEVADGGGEAGRPGGGQGDGDAQGPPGGGRGGDDGQGPPPGGGGG